MSETPILLSLAAMVGGFIRGFSGFGGPMIIIPILNLFYPPSLSIWIMALVDLAPNTYLVPTAWQYARVRIYLPLIIGSLLTLPVGVYALVVMDALIMQRVICVGIILSCCLLMSGWLFRGQLKTGSWIAIGAASGLVIGATLIAAVTSVFLNAASRKTDQNRANFILWASVIGVAVVVLLSRQDIALTEHLPVVAVLTVIYFAGCIAGTLAQRRFKNTLSRQLTLALIMIVASASLASSYGLLG